MLMTLYKVPIELVDALKKAINKREHASSMIKSYTDDWVTQQKKIIELNTVIRRIQND